MIQAIAYYVFMEGAEPVFLTWIKHLAKVKVKTSGGPGHNAFVKHKDEEMLPGGTTARCGTGGRLEGGACDTTDQGWRRVDCFLPPPP